MEFIALDIGTSFTKGAIIDVEELKIRSLRRVASPQRLPSQDPLVHELDAGNVVAGAKQIIDQLALECPNAAGIQVTGQMGGLVLCNGDGTARRPYISWLDRRATSRPVGSDKTHFDRLSEIVGDRSLSVLGNEFRPGLPLTFLHTLKTTGELANHPGTIPVTLPDYIAAALCEVTPVMEWTSATGLLDVNKKAFPAELLSDLGLNNLQLPKLVDFRHRVGDYTSVKRAIPVYAATGDHQCSLAGTLLQPQELSINISTGSQVSLLTDEATIGDYQVRPFFEGRFLRTITNIPAGRALTAIINLLTEMPGTERNLKTAYGFFFEQARQTPESDIEINLGLFPGAVAGPGFLSNLNEGNLTTGHIARSCVNQMATTYQQLTERLDPKRTWRQIAFSGGIARMSELLRNQISTALKADYRLAAESEDSMLGMIVLGRVIGGLDPSVAAASDYVSRRTQEMKSDPRSL